MEGKTVQQRYVSAWSEIENPPLDGVNPHFRNRYATLKATLEAVRKACKDNGMAYVQKLVRTEDGGRALRSSLLTDAGEVMELSDFPVEAPPNPQSFGSNLTYAKRQQAQADWGIVGEEDDDGEAAAKASKQPPKGPFNARCEGCGTPFSFPNNEALHAFQCPNCGNTTAEVM